MNTLKEYITSPESAKDLYLTYLSESVWNPDKFENIYNYILNHQNFDDLDMLLEEYDLTSKTDITRACILIPNTTPEKLLETLNIKEELNLVHTQSLHRSRIIVVYFLKHISNEEIKLLFKNYYIDHYLIKD